MKNLNRILVFLLLAFPILAIGQNIDHLKGKWQDKEKQNTYDLEVNGTDVRWKNEKSQNWNQLRWVKGTEYVDDDGYKYLFNEKKGTVKVVNPDNERDVRYANMVNFIPPGKTEPTTKQPSYTGGDDDYKGAHGFLMMYRGSAKAPIGISLGGIGKKFGIYAAYRFSARPAPYSRTVYTSNNNQQITDGQLDQDNGGGSNFDSRSYVYTGYSTEMRGAATIGAIIPINPFISAFGGFGLGWSNIWEAYDVYDDNTQDLIENGDDQQVWAINEDESIPAGFEFEFGAMAHWKVFNATLGISTVNFTSPDLVLGIGFQFY